MNDTLLDELQQTLKSSGPNQAIDRLCASLEDAKDYQSLFYALLMKKRKELGLSPIATGSNQDLPKEMHEPFEEAIRQSGRTVGQLYLRDGNIPAAFGYFQMIGEPEPIRAALEELTLPEGADCQPLIEIALHQQVHPRRGFDWLLERHGTCNAITTMSSDIPLAQDVRAYCVQKLIRTLHTELLARLKAEIVSKQGFEPTGKTIAELIEGRDWLFSDDYYHIDLSHLNAVTQMSINLEACPELQLARDLCAYGKKLSPKFLYPSDPPFDKQYHDYDVYLGILTGADVEGGVAYFRKKAEEADPHEVGTFPAQVLVNLLLRLKRPQEALAAARQFLAHVSNERLSCPNLVELCQQTGDYSVLAAVAREQGNPVNYLAALIGSQK